MTTGTGTVEYNKNGNQTIVAVDYYNLDLTTGGTKTQAGNVAVANMLTTDVGVTLDGSSRNLTLGDNWNNNGTFAASTSTVIYNKNGDQSVVACSYNNLTLSTAGNKTLIDDISVSGALVVNGPAVLVHNNKAVSYDGASDQTIAAADYYDISVSGDNIKTYGPATTIANNLAIANATTFRLTAALDIANVLTIDNAAGRLALNSQLLINN